MDESNDKNTQDDHRIATVRGESDEQVALQGNIAPSATNQVAGETIPRFRHIMGICS